jgi:hypothetical protein
MRHENTKTKKISGAVTRLVASRLGKILFEQFRSIVEDKERWAEMAEELRLKLLEAMPMPSHKKKLKGGKKVIGSLPLR